MKKDIAILTDCICDLPDELIEKHDIGIVYHYIFTENARFMDVDEITAVNVFDYMATGKMPTTDNPTVEEYIELFRQYLQNAEQLIYFVLTSGMATTFSCAMDAKAALGADGDRVHIIDTKQLSSAIGHIVLNAAAMVEAGKSVDEIVTESEAYAKRVKCSFIVKNVDYLYKNNRVSMWLQRVCKVFNIHPVLAMKDGDMTVKRIFIGNYENAQIKYIRSELKKNDDIQKELLFITHAGCNVKEIAAAREEIDRHCTFERTLVTNASATVSCNCGPHTIGVLYVTE